MRGKRRSLPDDRSRVVRDAEVRRGGGGQVEHAFGHGHRLAVDREPFRVEVLAQQHPVADVVQIVVAHFAPAGRSQQQPLLGGIVDRSEADSGLVRIRVAEPIEDEVAVVGKKRRPHAPAKLPRGHLARRAARVAHHPHAIQRSDAPREIEDVAAAAP